MFRSRIFPRVFLANSKWERKSGELHFTVCFSFNFSESFFFLRSSFSSRGEIAFRCSWLKTCWLKTCSGERICFSYFSMGSRSKHIRVDWLEKLVVLVAPFLSIRASGKDNKHSFEQLILVGFKKLYSPRGKKSIRINNQRNYVPIHLYTYNQ